MPIDYKKYHPEWAKKIRPDILARANNKCEQCGVENHIKGWREPNGTFWPVKECICLLEDEDYDIFSNELNNIGSNQKPIMIVLTIAHLDHNTFNNDYSNLKALCQRCHLRLDNDFHIKNRKQSTNKKKGLQELF